MSTLNGPIGLQVNCQKGKNNDTNKNIIQPIRAFLPIGLDFLSQPLVRSLINKNTFLSIDK